MRRHVLAALVTNQPGVLAGVAGMFAARGFNIDSLVVGRTEDSEYSRMTIVVKGNSRMLEQVRKQLVKMVEVVQVVDYSQADFVERDLMLCRVKTSAADRSQVIELANLFRARIVDVARSELMIEMAGSEEKIEAFLDLITPFGIVEMARTGIIAMERGEKVAGRKPVRRTLDLMGFDDEEEDTSGLVDPSQLPPG